MAGNMESKLKATLYDCLKHLPNLNKLNGEGGWHMPPRKMRQYRRGKSFCSGIRWFPVPFLSMESSRGPPSAQKSSIRHPSDYLYSQHACKGASNAKTNLRASCANNNMRSLDGLLAKGKKILKYGVYGAVGLASFLPMKEAMGQDVEWYLNPFNRPRETTIYYGSSDVNSDGKIDQDDYDAMAGGVQNDMADVDGDGTPSTTEDMQLLDDYIKGNIAYLPGHWNQLQTREERDDWVRKVLAIDKTDTLPYLPDEWISGDYARQLYLNFFGYEGQDIPDKYDTNMIGRFNLPVYYCWPRGPPGNVTFSHGMNAILTGNDPLNFDDWNPIEPQNDNTNVEPGGWNMKLPCRVNIEGIISFPKYYGERIALVKFLLDSTDIDSLYYQHPDLVLTRTLQDTIPPEISLSIDKEIFKDSIDIVGTSNEEVNFDLYIYDSLSNKVWHRYTLDYDDVIIERTWDGKGNTGDGKYTITLIAEDEARNTKEVSDTVTLDTTPPEISITYPENDSLYTSHVTDLEYLVSDANPDRMWYSTDGGLTRIVVPWSSDTTITGLKSEQGTNTWYLYAQDEAGNKSSDSVTFNVDTTSTGIEDPTVPFEYSLSQNYPNPFNPSTTIEYTLSKGGDVSLIIYDLTGKKLETLVDETQSPVPYKIPFDASKYPSGIYFYRLRTEDFNKTKKMLLVK